MLRYLILLVSVLWAISALASYVAGSFNVYLALLTIANFGWFISENELHKIREKPTPDRELT